MSNFKHAVVFAIIFIDSNLGNLQDIINYFNLITFSIFTRALVSEVGQQREANGFFRSFLRKKPAALLFFSPTIGDLSYSYIYHRSIVPNSCPNVTATDSKFMNFLPLKRQLNLLTQDVRPVPQNLSFSFQQPASSLDPS